MPLNEFLQLETYPVIYTDVNKEKKLTYDHPNARPILFREFVKIPTLIHALLDHWYKPQLGVIDSAEVLTFYCEGCNRRIVIDGNHRLAWLAFYGKSDAKISVNELAGSHWPKREPDINIICECVI